MIKVLRPGLHTSIQDLGRLGYRNYGVPLGGAMDFISASFANALLNNDKNEAVLEITMHGPKLEFLAETVIVITGAEMSPKINDKLINNNKLYIVKKRDILSFGKLLKGSRCYLGVKGGFQTESFLNSKSFYEGVTPAGAFFKNDLISIKPYIPKRNLSKGIINAKNQFYESSVIEVYEGPDLKMFSISEQEKLFATSFSISNKSNRMGYRLNETVISNNKSIITSPVMPGTVQLIPTGKLIVLMKDAQTTGGYPRVLQLSEKSIAILAQKNTGDKFIFKLISY